MLFHRIFLSSATFAVGGSVEKLIMQRHVNNRCGFHLSLSAALYIRERGGAGYATQGSRGGIHMGTKQWFDRGIFRFGRPVYFLAAMVVVGQPRSSIA